MSAVSAALAFAKADGTISGNFRMPDPANPGQFLSTLIEGIAKPNIKMPYCRFEDRGETQDEFFGIGTRNSQPYWCRERFAMMVVGERRGPVHTLGLLLKNKFDKAILTLNPLVAPPSVAPTVSNTPAVSSLLAGLHTVSYTYVTPLGETTASPTASITIAAGDKITVTPSLSPLDAGATSVRWYVNGLLATAGFADSLDIVAEPSGGGPPGSNTARSNNDVCMSCDCELFDVMEDPQLDQNQSKVMLGILHYSVFATKFTTP